MAINGAVLAGGRSTRMGRDKALLPIAGIPMALRMAGVLRDGGCRSVHLVGRQQTLGRLGVPLVQDVSKTYHPLVGVAAALEHIPGEFVLLCPCDLIYLEAVHVRVLLQVGEPCVAVSDGQVHPLLSILPTRWAGKARELAEAGAPAMALSGLLPRVDLPYPSLTDANAPIDLPR